MPSGMGYHPYLQVTIDSEGIRKIERLMSRPVYSASGHRYYDDDDRFFVESKRLGHIDVQFKVPLLNKFHHLIEAVS